VALVDEGMGKLERKTATTKSTAAIKTTMKATTTTTTTTTTAKNTKNNNNSNIEHPRGTANMFETVALLYFINSAIASVAENVGKA
jgi:hypothetical protein